MQKLDPSWRALRRVSRWAIVACAGWACLNPQPDTDPLETGPGDGSAGQTATPSGSGGGAGNISGSAGSGGGAGSGGSSATSGNAGSAGSGSAPQPDAGDGGVPTPVGDAGAEVGDAGP